MVQASTLSLGDLVRQTIEAHLSSEKVRAYPLNQFMEQRIQIKDLFNKIVPLIPNAVQLHHQRQKQRYIKAGKKPHFLLLKYRRGGFTTWEQALSYRAAVTVPNVNCATVADTQKNTNTIFRMVLLMLRLDDELLYPPSESKSHIGIKTLNTFFDVGTAGAKAFSRGDNIYRFHGSEVSRWPGTIEVLEDLAAGFTEAARYGEVVLETTADGARGWFYEKFKEAMAGESSWIPLFYPWFIDTNNFIEPITETTNEFFDTISDEEKKSMEKFSLTTGQMLWRREKQFERKKLFQQEYPETWEQAFIVRGLTFFDLEMIDSLSQKVQNPIKKTDTLTVWEHPKSENEYTAGADCSEGTVTGDLSVCGILNKKTGKQAAVLRGRWRPEVFARKCVELCKKYNGAIFACEVNNHGHSVMNTVVNTLLYKHLYFRLQNLGKDKWGKKIQEKKPGWLTNASTRPILLDELNESLEEEFMQVNDTTFLAECKTFVDDGGKYQADKGQHDDTIIAWGVAWQARKQVKRNFSIV